MSRNSHSHELRQLVETRAVSRCEYCLTPMEISTQPFEIEHIIPLSKKGLSTPENLALSCRGCNSHKYNKTEAVDNISDKKVPIYNPRADQWKTHFAWDRNPLYLKGLTPTGRATIQALKLNRAQLISVRRILQQIHMHPPR
ncbi:MAG: HNH endonuclease [Phaeodactylibacter xiamenensis]|uniref:HNH nuclease domain-containing protein n=1 Tax=Phaeodactylibacter xiamenensis TaxID=1524460 RepID=A0A098S1V0_9BACT|nr:hypothetical protein IX84_23225 [Phaeodactylibacter xiamenensis]